MDETHGVDPALEQGSETSMALALQEALSKSQAAAMVLKEKLIQSRKELAQAQEEVGDLEDRLLVATDHATYDPRTHLFRRETFEEGVREMLSGGVCGAFVVLDLQGFGEINAKFGHPTGDLMISYAADAIRRRMRVRKRVHRLEDLYCRLGGDEFALLLTDVPEDQVVPIVNGINAKAQEIDKRLMFYFGYAICEPGDTFESLYERADEHLWVHKNKIKSEKRVRQAYAIMQEIVPLVLAGNIEEAQSVLLYRLP